MSDPYHDEDAEETTMSVRNDMFQKTNDPPLIQAFKHMGHTFRNGGFCVERSKVEKKQANVQTVQESAEVEETDVSDVSSPTSADGNAMEVRFNDLAAPLIVEDQNPNGSDEIEVISVPKMATTDTNITSPSSVKPSSSNESSFLMLSCLLVTLTSVGLYSVLSEQPIAITNLMDTIKTSGCIHDMMDDPKTMYSAIGISSILTTMVYLYMPFSNKSTDSKLKSVVETAWAFFLLGMITVGVKMSLF